MPGVRTSGQVHLSGQPPRAVGLARPSHCSRCVQTRDQIEIIESAYALDIPDVQWQYRLTDLISEQWGGTAASFLYDASGPNEIACQRVIVKIAGERIIVDAPKSIPLDDPILRQALFVTRPHLAQLVDLIGPELSDTEGCRRVLDVVRELNPGPFSVVLRTLDRNQKGLFFALPSRPIGDRMRGMWGEIAVHIGLAYRLRCTLLGKNSPDSSKGDPAVLRRALRQATHNVLREVALWAPVTPGRRTPGSL